MKLKDRNITAEVLLDSICNGHRLTTMKVRCPRIILAEFNTHRAFSRNSASSRAIPTAKFRQRVEDEPYFPCQWNIAGKGMSAAGAMDELAASLQQDLATAQLFNVLEWHEECESRLGTAKEQLNRYLEPFMYTEILVSATEWLNFFYLRCSPQADQAMQMTADAMLEAYIQSKPTPLHPGAWHLPFQMQQDSPLSTADVIKVCTARSARVTYFNFGEEGKDPDHAKDIATHDKLLRSLHMSPFEHCAQAMTKQNSGKGRTPRYFASAPEGGSTYFRAGRCANFTGWMQYRTWFNGIMENELAALNGDGGLEALHAKRKEAM